MLIRQSLILQLLFFFNARLAQTSLITKTDFGAKLSSLNRKITQNKSKHVLVENELTTLKNKIPDVSSLVRKTDYSTRVAAIDTKISRLDDEITKYKNELKKLTEGITLFLLGNLMFDAEDGTQAYLIFQAVHKYLKITANTKFISEWKSKGLSDESIKPFPTSDNSLTRLIGYYSYKIRLKFNGSILRQPKVTYTHGKSVNNQNVYELSASSQNNDDPALKSCLFGAVTLTKNADIEKYKYSGYGTGFGMVKTY